MHCSVAGSRTRRRSRGRWSVHSQPRGVVCVKLVTPADPPSTTSSGRGGTNYAALLPARSLGQDLADGKELCQPAADCRRDEANDRSRSAAPPCKAGLLGLPSLISVSQTGLINSFYFLQWLQAIPTPPPSNPAPPDEHSSDETATSSDAQISSSDDQSADGHYPEMEKRATYAAAPETRVGA